MKFGSIQFLVALLLCASVQAATPAFDPRYPEFRDSVIDYVRTSAYNQLAGAEVPRMSDRRFDRQGHWSVEVVAYLGGIIRGVGHARAFDRLSTVLHSAVLESIKGQMPLTFDDLDNTRFVVRFHYPPNRVAAIVGYHGRGRELIGDIVPVRELDRKQVESALERARGYLLRIMDPSLHAFPKMYFAHHDRLENRVRTIYSASSLYTLLKLDAWRRDAAIETRIPDIAGFLLSMQCTESPCRGGFSYSYFPDEKRREQRYVVGTASKTIFTLLELWRSTQAKRYLDSAILAGDWLVTMVNPDGTVAAALEYKDNTWHRENRFSLLYSGQVLSALSRLYSATPKSAYKSAAGRIAALFLEKMQTAHGQVLGDEFREPNSVSTSWVGKSLYDYSRIDSDPAIHKAIYQAFDAVLANQVDAPWDPYYDGSIYDDPSSSGTGWVNEVLIDVYHLCREDGREDCNRYSNAMALISRWLLQRSYTLEDGFNLENPAHAEGGAIRNYGETIVRTDAVCHGSNSLLGLLEISGDSIHVSRPPTPFDQFFKAIRLEVDLGGGHPSPGKSGSE